MSMESLNFVKKVLRGVWKDFIAHLDVKKNAAKNLYPNLIDMTTLELISAAKSTADANQIFLFHLNSSATIESLENLCTMLHETAQDYPPHGKLAELLEDQLKQRPKTLRHIVDTPSLAKYLPVSLHPRPGRTPHLQIQGKPSLSRVVNPPRRDEHIPAYQPPPRANQDPSRPSDQRPDQTNSTPHSGHSQPGQISSCQPPSTARQDTSPSDPKKTKYRFAIMVANENEMNATMHFLGCSEEDGYNYKVTEDVQSYTYEGDKKLKTEIILVGKPFKSYVPITVGTISGVVVQCGAAGSFTPMGSHRTTLQLVKDAKEGSWELNMIFIVGCCATRPETVTNVEEQHDSPPAAKRLKPSKGKNKKRKPNNVSNPARSHNKPNKIVPLGTVLVADEIFQYAMGKLEDDGPKWIPKSCFSPPLLEFNTAQRGIDACRIVKKEVATFLSGDFVIKGEVTASELGDLHKNRDYVGFEMEGVGAMKAIKDAKIFLPKLPMPEVFLVKGVSDKAGRDKNKEQNLLFFSGKLMKNVKEDSRQQMCTIMSLTLVLRYIIQNITIFKANK